MHRAAFTNEAGSEFLKHVIRRNERSMELLDRIPIIRLVMTIFIVRRGVVELGWNGIDSHFDPKRSQRGHVFRIEVGDASSIEPDDVLTSIAGSDMNSMRNEIELDLESLATVRNGGGRQAQRRDIKNNVP